MLHRYIPDSLFEKELDFFCVFFWNISDCDCLSDFMDIEGKHGGDVY